MGRTDFVRESPMDRTRKCQWCYARYGEKQFKCRLRNCCDSCGRMRARRRCPRCTGPELRGRCPRCDPAPEGKVMIILLDKTSDDERVIYRCPQPHGKRYLINLLGRIVSVVDPEEPIVISLTRKEFLSTLC